MSPLGNGFTRSSTKSMGPPAPVASVSGESSKKTSPWISYMKEQMETLKGHKRPGSELMKEISVSWKALSTEDKAKYADKVVTTATTTVPIKHKMSGWNLYVKEQMPALKEQIKSGADRMKQVSADWKALGTDGQRAINDRAKAL